MFAKNAEELVIYQIALELTKEIDKLVKQIPHYWDIEECRQILRSSSSAPSNIEEGFAQRFYPKKFLYYLNIALGSSDESKGHLRKLYNNGHIKTEIANHYIGRYKNLSVRILKFINYLKKKHNIILN
jgi:four helix bundle protein